MDNLLSLLRLRLEEVSKGVSNSNYQLLSEYHFDLRFSPSRHDDFYWAHAVGITTPSSSGACFCPHGGKICGDPGIVADRDVRTLRDQHTCREIAALDAAFGVTIGKADLRYTAQGSPAEKSTVRANAIANEIERLTSSCRPSRSRIVMVGAVGNILSELSSRGYQLLATDFDDTLIGREIAGAWVESGEHTLRRVAECDVALVTGMTLATDSISQILEVSRASGTRLVFFCQTGGNLAAEYTAIGASAVVTESFPFYMLPGATEFLIFRSPQ
jgi:Putative heavy-metal chelation